MGIGVQRYDPAALVPKKKTGTSFTGRWWAHDYSRRESKIPLRPELDLRTLHPVESRSLWKDLK
jgi:hypothetical protein